MSKGIRGSSFSSLLFVVAAGRPEHDVELFACRESDADAASPPVVTSAVRAPRPMPRKQWFMLR